MACANVANLMLARATDRQREIAVRAAMGAGTPASVRQLLTESIMLSLASAGLGLLGAPGRWLLAIRRDSSDPAGESRPGGVRVLLFTIGVSVLIGALFGLAPALQSYRLNLSDELKSSAQAVVSPSGTRRILRDVLVISEIAASLALLVGAGLLCEVSHACVVRKLACKRKT